MRQRAERPVPVGVDKAAPQQTFAQIDVFIAPSPVLYLKIRWPPRNAHSA
jgi:hypothetical protein